MSNRILIEINTDFLPHTAETVEAWGEKIMDYVRTGNERELPPGVLFLNWRHHSEGCPIQTLRYIREHGWVVAAHNDYTIGRGKAKRQMTFWLFTNPATGRFVKGEGITDAVACELAFHAIMNPSRVRHPDDAPPELGSGSSAAW